MLTIEYEQSLVETVVFLAVRRDERLECELHQAIDRLYEIPDEELRQREFVPVFRDFFTRLGLARVIDGLLTERPLIGNRVDQCIVREAARKKAESADLFTRGTNDTVATHTMVIQVCPQSLIEPERFILLMRREILHVADMLDERFGYEREVFPGSLPQQNLQRDRYRVLWDTFVEGRLGREGLGTNGEPARLKGAFGRVFANGSTCGYDDVYRRVFDTPLLTHRNLMDWAAQPNLLFQSELSVEKNQASSSGPVQTTASANRTGS